MFLVLEDNFSTRKSVPIIKNECTFTPKSDS